MILLCRLLIVFGLGGFLGQLLLPKAGTNLGKLELPAILDTSAIRLSNGRTLTATIPSQRLQLHDATGSFMRGWFAPVHGGAFAVGLSNRDEIVVCSARGREATIYDLDGHTVATRRCRFDDRRLLPRIADPGEIIIDGVMLRDAPLAPVQVPTASQWLLLPLWHPATAVALTLLGAFALRLTRQ